MRIALIMLPLAMAGCAGLDNIPSLAPRPMEKMDLGSPAAPPPVVAVPASGALNARIGELMANVRAGDAAFMTEERTNSRTIAAGLRASEGSEAWIAGETARSALEAARQKSADALAALDQLLVEASTEGGAGLAEIGAAKEQADAIVSRQTARLDELSR